MLATALQWQWSERAAVYYCFINILRHVGSCSRCGRANWLNQRGRLATGGGALRWLPFLAIGH